jgi:hypothetical protein
MARDLKPPDWEAIARAHQAIKTGPECTICARPEVDKGVRVMCEERAAGRSVISYAGMAAEIKKALGLVFTGPTIRRHVARHLPELYVRIKVHERQS